MVKLFILKKLRPPFIFVADGFFFLNWNYIFWRFLDLNDFRRRYFLVWRGSVRRDVSDGVDTVGARWVVGGIGRNMSDCLSVFVWNF